MLHGCVVTHYRLIAKVLFKCTCNDEEIVTLTEIVFCGGCGAEVGNVCCSGDAQGSWSQIAYDGDL